MRELFAQIPGMLVDAVIYSAILLVFLIGLSKCVFPYRRGARLLRRATRSLELMVTKEGTRPVWQDPLFLGKPMQENWKRFLLNAEQLDMRGLSCNCEDYINDEEAFGSYAHLQLAVADGREHNGQGRVHRRYDRNFRDSPCRAAPCHCRSFSTIRLLLYHIIVFASKILYHISERK